MSYYQKGELVRSKKYGNIGLVIWVMEAEPGLVTLFKVHWVTPTPNRYLAEWFREGTDFLSERVEKL